MGCRRYPGPNPRGSAHPTSGPQPHGTSVSRSPYRSNNNNYYCCCYCHYYCYYCCCYCYYCYYCYYYYY